MSFYALTALINALVASFLGLVVYYKNREIIINKTFGLFCFFVAIWSYSYFFWQISTTEEVALFWCRALMAGAIFITISYFHFILCFIKKVKKYKKDLIFGYLIFVFFFFSNFTSFFVKNVTTKLNFLYWPNPGILYHPFLILWIFYAIYPIYLLFREFSIATDTDILKSQIKYILIGTIVGYSGGITNYFLWYNISVPPFGNLSTTFYLIVVVYAILKYHLLGIRVILTEFLVGAIALILLIQAVTAETLLLKVLGLGILFLFSIVGYFLIKSVLREIELRGNLQKAYAEVDRLSKAKSEFISIASHQLRTPLTAIKGYISMILEGDYGSIVEEARKPMDNVYKSNERLIKLVNDLLSVSRIESGKIELELQKSSIEEVISNIISVLKIEAEKKNLYLKWEKPAEPLPKILIDQEKVRQVILNIVDNAIKYTNKGGVTINTEIKDSNCQIKVSDTGEGMEKEEINYLFESFTRGKVGVQFHTEGAGLGLYIARKFVEMHQGKIWAESAGKGKGSTFYIELPIK